MGRPSLNPISDANSFADLGNAPVPNPVLFEEGDWRLYGHIEDEYSTMAHRCPKWANGGQWGEGEHPPEWRWYWGNGPCGKCHNTAPDGITTVYTLHNFDRISGMK